MTRLRVRFPSGTQKVFLREQLENVHIKNLTVLLLKWNSCLKWNNFHHPRAQKTQPSITPWNFYNGLRRVTVSGGWFNPNPDPKPNPNPNSRPCKSVPALWKTVPQRSLLKIGQGPLKMGGWGGFSRHFFGKKLNILKPSYWKKLKSRNRWNLSPNLTQFTWH